MPPTPFQDSFAVGPWHTLFVTARFIFIFLDLVLFAGIIYVVVHIRELRIRLPEPTLPPLPPAVFDPQLKVKWKMILANADSQPPHSYVTAIISADKFVDDILKKMGLSGEHMADRLESLTDRNFTHLERVWRAHRIRNELVHAPDYEITHADAEEVLRAYQGLLSEIGVL